MDQDDVQCQFINNFRLLSLYIDIRCYDNEIRKIHEKALALSDLDTSRTGSRIDQLTASKISTDRRVSVNSNKQSVTPEKNQEYLEAAKKLSLMIFNEYLKKEAPLEVQLEDHVKCAIYQRFGCYFNEDDSY